MSSESNPVEHKDKPVMSNDEKGRRDYHFWNYRNEYIAFGDSSKACKKIPTRSFIHPTECGAIDYRGPKVMYVLDIFSS